MEEIVLSPWKLWAGAIGWTLVGILFVKSLVYPFKKKFSLKIWIEENLLDVIRGVLLTLITVKLGDIVIQLLTKYLGLDFSGINEAITSAGLDPVQISLLIAIVFQMWLYKRRLKIDIKSPPPPQEDETGGENPPLGG